MVVKATGSHLSLILQSSAKFENTLRACKITVVQNHNIPYVVQSGTPHKEALYPVILAGKVQVPHGTHMYTCIQCMHTYTHARAHTSLDCLI